MHWLTLRTQSGMGNSGSYSIHGHNKKLLSSMPLFPLHSGFFLCKSVKNSHVSSRHIQSHIYTYSLITSNKLEACQNDSTAFTMCQQFYPQCDNSDSQCDNGNLVCEVLKSSVAREVWMSNGFDVKQF